MFIHGNNMENEELYPPITWKYLQSLKMVELHDNGHVSSEEILAAKQTPEIIATYE